MKIELKKYYLVCYDIENTKQRNRLVKVLKNYGTRVQKSVFEMFLNEEYTQQMIDEAAPYIGEADSFRVYALSKSAYKRKVTLGVPFDYLPDEDVII